MLKLSLYYMLQSYSKQALAFILASTVAAALPQALTPPAYRGDLAKALLPAMAALLTVVAAISVFTSAAAFKADVDFIYSTPADPREVYSARIIGGAPLYAAFMLSYTFSAVDVGNAVWYAVALVSLSLAFSAAGANAALLSPAGRALSLLPLAIASALVYLSPEISPLYGLAAPAPLYSAYAAGLFGAYLLAAPWRTIEELSRNAYGVLGQEPQMGESKSRLPDSFWGVVWTTTVRAPFTARASARGTVVIYQRTFNALKYLTPASLAGATAYLAAALWTKHYAASSVMAAYVVYMAFASAAALGVANERLWISLAADPLRYLRYRALARTLLSALVLSPWIAAFALASLLYPPALYLSAFLASSVLVLPSLSWIAAAYSGIPQIRELGLAQRPQRISLRNLLMVATIVLFMALNIAPFFLSAIAYSADAFRGLSSAAEVYAAVSLAASLSAFCLLVCSEAGRPVWMWAVNKLSENGYV